MKHDQSLSTEATRVSNNDSSAELEEPLPDPDHYSAAIAVIEDEEQGALLDKSKEDKHTPMKSSGPAHIVQSEEAQLPAGQQDAAKLLKKPVPWRALPRKDQLVILTLARLAEPLFQASLQSYMFFMLQSFDPSLSDSEISTQAGFLAGAFTAAQCLTAVWWGKLADDRRVGRKNIVLVGLIGSFFSSIGFGFSKTFWSAMFFRCLGGALNGNIGVMRTMIAEFIKEKRFQPKAFLILPATFNFGILVGPLLGGWLQNPVATFPNAFGPGSKLGGVAGVQWMIDYPYAFPNLLNAVFFLLSTTLVVLGLEDTLIDRVHLVDPGLRTGRWIKGKIVGLFRRSPAPYEYISLQEDAPLTSIQQSGNSRGNLPSASLPDPNRPRPKLPYRRIFTSNLIFTLLTHGMLHVHSSAFNNMWFLFLSTPRFDPAHPEPPSHEAQRLPFSFTGGLGLDPPTIGLAIGIIGFVGLAMQFGVYSKVTFRLGIVMTYRLAMISTFPIVYSLVPYLAMVPTSSPSPAAANGFFVWFAIIALLFLQVVGRTFVLPIGQILVNNCSPHPSVLGSVHGIGQSVSSGGRTIGPVIWSYLYGLGLDKGIVGIAWWILGIEALFAAGCAWLLREGSGHEIWLEGD